MQSFRFGPKEEIWWNHKLGKSSKIFSRTYELEFQTDSEILRLNTVRWSRSSTLSSTVYWKHHRTAFRTCKKFDWFRKNLSLERSNKDVGSGLQAANRFKPAEKSSEFSGLEIVLVTLFKFSGCSTFLKTKVWSVCFVGRHSRKVYALGKNVAGLRKANPTWLSLFFRL